MSAQIVYIAKQLFRHKSLSLKVSAFSAVKYSEPSAPETLFGFGEIEAGELAVILYRRLVVCLGCLDFAAVAAQIYSLFLQHYPGNPSVLVLVPVNSFIF